MARRHLAIVLVQPAGVPIDPGLHREAMTTERRDGERAHEPVAAGGDEWTFAPPTTRGLVADDRPDHLVTVPCDGHGDRDVVAEARLRRPAAAVDLRLQLAQDDPLGRHRPAHGKQVLT